MANDEVLGPRKTMFVLVIVVGCFAVLWPRILSPLILGHTSEQLKPNKFDREAGCCEVIFEREVAYLELLNEVCNSALNRGNYTTAVECRKAVNETCGVDIAAFVKRNENVGKTTKMLMETITNSNSSCLRQHFGVPVYSLSTHFGTNSWKLQDTLKQERPSIRMGPHPALRERGRAIPPGPPPPSRPVTLPPHVRVRSPLSVYYMDDKDVKPPPIPGMRPPLGSPGGPVPAPKSSMGFVMPIYTICIIVFFVYTLSKILFKRTGSVPYDPVPPDPQFRRRVFRDDSRTSPDKFVVSAISGLVAEVQQQMEASYTQNQQRQEALDNARPYTNGTILLNSGPVQIVTSEYREPKEKTPELEKDQPPLIKTDLDEISSVDIRETLNKIEKEPSLEPVETVAELEESSVIQKEEPDIEIETLTEEIKEDSLIKLNETKKKSQDITNETEESEPDLAQKVANDLDDIIKELKEKSNSKDSDDEFIAEELKTESKIESDVELRDSTSETDAKLGEESKAALKDANVNLIQLADELESNEVDPLKKLAEDFLNEERKEQKQQKESTPELLEEAIKDVSTDDNLDDKENQSVKVIGMELTAHPADGGAWRPDPAPVVTSPKPHKAEDVKSIFLETEIPQQSRVLVADFAEDRTDKPEPSKNSPLVVSGKITLSLIQNAPRDTPDRDLESTVDDFTTASGLTQPAAEKEDDLSDEEIEEVEEIEEIEEIEEEEEEEEPEQEVRKK